MKKLVRILAIALLISLMIGSLTACSFDIKKMKTLFRSLYDCETCCDKGVIDCSHCNGKGDTKCILCNGKGERDCTLCMGRGYRTCIMCSGMGGTYRYDYFLGYSRYQTCYSCIGGRVTCIKSYPCTTCYNGKKDCSFCHGSGNVYCPDCEKN